MVLSPAMAEEFEVKMLNKGEKGTMVFEPDFIAAQPGDTIKFVPTDKGHNVESIEGMLPAGVEEFKSKFNVEYVLTVEEEGVYGVKCTPHYTMGMVALIAVGELGNLEEAQAVKHKGKSKKVFADLFEQVQ
ncbi:pseudoazurin [Maritalea sp. P4.10X]|uniref:Pseudoazurin n=1 Tax=Maritalea mediterranea TaxID=2909667 RepID=A0ABS9EAP2_9HYPH|nr:pseudoazurin [Maritalea mediterranea]MCF4099956.1 pseudoazurin [Maritalea mediterranea]